MYSLSILKAVVIVALLLQNAPQAHFSQFSEEAQARLKIFASGVSRLDREQAIESWTERFHAESAGLIDLTKAARQKSGANRIARDSDEYCALTVIGVMRAKDAVPTLVDNIDTRDDAFSLVSNQPFEHFQNFPFAVTLCKIGDPSIPFLLEIIRTEESSKTRFAVACLSIKSILTEEPAIAAITVFHRLNKRFDEKKLDAASRLIRLPREEWRADTASDFSRQ